MSPPDERAPRGFLEAPNNSATTPNSQPKSSRSKPTQGDRIKRMLSHGWSCGLDFLKPADGYAPILRYTARIYELRQNGWLIERRECQHPWHDHRESTMWQWKIVGHVNDGHLPGLGEWSQ